MDTSFPTTPLSKFKNFLKERKKLLGILGLVVLLLAIPLGVWLLQQTQIFAPKAAVAPIQLVSSSDCFVSSDPNKVKCASFQIQLTSPLGPPASPSPSVSPTPVPSSSSCTSDSQCSSGEKCFNYQNYSGSCKPSDTVCAQVITNACNPDNPSECVDFPTPCQVPPGWITANSSPSPIASNGLSQGLVGYWNLDQTANTMTDSRSNNGTSTGTTSVTGKIGKARSFNTDTDKIITSPVSLGLNDMTVAAWVDLKQSIYAEAIANQWGPNAVAWNFSIVNKDTPNSWASTTPGKPYLHFNAQGCSNNNLGWVISNDSVPMNGWHHLAATRSGTDGKIKLFIDGNEIASTIGSPETTGTPCSQAIPLGIGLFSDGVNYPFKGAIDEVGIWNRVLSPAEISSLAAQTTSLSQGASNWLFVENLLSKVAKTASKIIPEVNAQVCQVPSAPTNFQPTSITSQTLPPGQQTISWSPGAGAAPTEYLVKLDDLTATADFVDCGSGDVPQNPGDICIRHNGTNSVTANLVNGHTYNLVVFAANNCGFSPTAGGGSFNVVTPSSPNPTASASVACLNPASPVNAFYYTNRLSFYYTADQAYFPTLTAGGWTDAGTVFYAYKTQVPGTVPVYSTYYTNRLSRYLTTNAAYLPTLAAAGWTNEGAMFYAYDHQVPGTVGIHSFYYSNRLDRFLIADNSSWYFPTLAAAGWTDEGPIFYAYPTQEASCDTSSASPSPNASASPDANLPGTSYYKVSETEAGLTSAPQIAYTVEPTITDFSFSDPTPGTKQIWVEFIGADGSTRKEHISVELIEPQPVITSLDCSMDISKQDLKLTLKGTGLGNGSGNIKANDKDAEILSWNNTQATAIVKSPGNLDDGKLFKVKLTKSDSTVLPEVTCQVNTALLSLGAFLFCREPGKFDIQNVKVLLADENGNKVNETVTIDKDGILKGLKTKLQSGKPYVISIKAPYSLRRNAEFTAADGTTVITPDDNANFILPVGDIAPVIQQDGKINTLDRSEIVRQWSVLGTGTTKTGDFNRDTKINSIDWACMRYDFNSEDDALPTRAGIPSPSPVSSSPVNASISPTSTPSLPSPSPSSAVVASPSPSAPVQNGSAFFLLAPEGNGAYNNGAEFDVDVRVSSQDEGANLFVAKLSFNPANLEVVSIQKGTALNNWTEDYFNNQTGVISLVAGTPSPGLQTTSGNDPLFAKITFKGKQTGLTDITLMPTSRIYSNNNNNDILGTLVSSQVQILP